MADTSIYHDGSRRLQDHFDSRRIAHALVQGAVRSQPTNAAAGSGRLTK
jgi:hypothetical protein